MTESTIFNHKGLAAPQIYFHKGSVRHLINELMRNVFVEQPLALPGSANYIGVCKFAVYQNSWIKAEHSIKLEWLVELTEKEKFFLIDSG